MKIAHVCLSCFFIDGRSYQENELVVQHISEGHDVIVIASTETHSSGGLITYTDPGTYVGAEGAMVHRVPYRRFLPHRIMTKLRMNVGVFSLLDEFAPDVILFHGTCGWELRTVARYVTEHPGVTLYVDSHEDWNNSARGFVSREVLHRQYYGRILRSVLSTVKKILCVTTESIEFVANLYQVPRNKLEFYPLGGYPLADDEYRKRREDTRRELGVAEDDVVILQSGKQTKRKKLLESMQALGQCENRKLRLFIAGVLHDEIRQAAEESIEHDERVTFLGWKSADELTNLLCAADVYLQPGTQSVTMQHSLCCRCAVIIDDVPAHQVYRCDNGWFLNDDVRLTSVFDLIGSANLVQMGRRSFEFACENLSYEKLAARVLV